MALHVLAYNLTGTLNIPGVEYPWGHADYGGGQGVLISSHPPQRVRLRQVYRDPVLTASETKGNTRS